MNKEEKLLRIEQRIASLKNNSNQILKELNRNDSEFSKEELNKLKKYNDADIDKLEKEYQVYSSNVSNHTK